MNSLSLKTLVQLVCTFASLCEGSLLRCKRLDQCLCLGAYFATIFCFRGLFSLFCGLFLGFTPSCICDSAGISELEMVRNTDNCGNYCERKVSLWTQRLLIEPCCFDRSKLHGFNFPLCHVGCEQEW